MVLSRSEPADAVSSSPPTSTRVVGLDAARAVALLGMVVVNVGPRDGEGPASWAFRAAHGRASLLFVVLAGIGVGLLLSSSRSRGWISLLVRGAVLLIGGLALQLLDHDVSVILPTYAALFALAVLAVRLPDRAVLGAALGTALLGPVVWLLSQRDAEFVIDAPTLTESPAQVAGAILLTGPYPLVTWSAPFLLGIWLGRRDLTSARVQRRLLVGGVVLAVLAVALSVATGSGDETARTEPGRLLSAVAHSQTPVWLIGSTGSALAVLGLVLVLAPRWPRAGAVLAALGRMSLTIYVAHLLVIALLVRPGPTTAAGGLAVAAVLAVVALLVANLWQRWFRRGPLEAALRAPERVLGRRSTSERHPTPSPGSTTR